MSKITAILLSSTALFAVNAFAVEIMERADFDKVASQYEKIGTVSTAGEVSIPDAKKELITKAEEKGADVLVLTSSNTSNLIHGTANIYKKK